MWTGSALPLLFGGREEECRAVVSAVTAEVLVEQPEAGLVAEVFGRLPLGTVPVSVPRQPERIERAVVSGAARQMLEHALLAMVAHRRRGRVEAALRLARSAMPLLEAARENVAAGIAALWYSEAGLAAFRAGEWESARLWLLAARRLRASSEIPTVERDVLARLALLGAWSGRTDEARSWVDAFDASAAPANPAAERHAVVTRLVLANEVVDFDAAAGWAALLADPREDDELWPFSAWALTRATLVHFEGHVVLRVVEDAAAFHAQRLAGSDGIDAEMVAMLRAEAIGMLGQGARSAAIAEGLFPKGRLAEWAGFHLCGLALVVGDYERARATASHALAAATLPRFVRMLLIERGVSAAACGREEEATAALSRAVRLTTSTEGIRSWGVVPRSMLEPLAGSIPGLPELLSLSPPIDGYRTNLVRLTKQEAVVLHALVAGDDQKTIAAGLFVSVNTLRSQLRTLYAKLGVSSREDAVARAVALGLLDPAS